MPLFFATPFQSSKLNLSIGGFTCPHGYRRSNAGAEPGRFLSRRRASVRSFDPPDFSIRSWPPKPLPTPRPPCAAQRSSRRQFIVHVWNLSIRARHRSGSAPEISCGESSRRICLAIVESLGIEPRRGRSCSQLRTKPSAKAGRKLGWAFGVSTKDHFSLEGTQDGTHPPETPARTGRHADSSRNGGCRGEQATVVAWTSRGIPTRCMPLPGAPTAKPWRRQASTTPFVSGTSPRKEIKKYDGHTKRSWPSPSHPMASISCRAVRITRRKSGIIRPPDRSRHSLGFQPRSRPSQSSPTARSLPPRPAS